jgi:hypothetical protein
MAFCFRLVGDVVGPQAVNLVLQAVQVCSYVRRGIRDEVGVTGLGMDDVEILRGKGRGSSLCGGAGC